MNTNHLPILFVDLEENSEVVEVPQRSSKSDWLAKARALISSAEGAFDSREITSKCLKAANEQQSVAAQMVFSSVRSAGMGPLAAALRSHCA